MLTTPASAQPWARRTFARLRGLDPVALVAILVLAVGAVQLGAGALSTGVTVDGPIQAEEARTWLDSGWYRPGGSAPGRTEQRSSPYVYGPAFEAVAHLANVAVGNEAIGEISDAPGAFEVRHLVVAALAALAIAAVGVAVSSLTGSRRIGLWAAAGLLAVPAWTGHGFFNPKDIPAGCGFTLVTVGLLLALAEGPNGALARRRRIAIAAMLAGGVFIGAGTRLTLLVPFLLSFLAYAALRLGQHRLGGVRRGAAADIAVAAGAGTGFAAIAALYPKAASSPLTLLVKSMSGSRAYPWHGFTLTAGRLLSEHPPWYYLPAWIGASYPLLLGGLAIFGAAAWIQAMPWARGRSLRGPLWRRPDLGLVLVFQQALLPAGAVITGAVIYDGMRQHLYILPAIAILAGVGAGRLWIWAQGGSGAGRRQGAVAALLSLALLVPMAEQTLLFPYNYAYVNPLAGSGGVNGRWETDYWFASAPEAFSRVPNEATPECLLELPYWRCDEAQVTRAGGRADADARAGLTGGDSGDWLILRRHNGNQPPEGCKQAGDVTRWLRGEEVVMSYVLRCRSRESNAGDFRRRKFSEPRGSARNG